MFDANWVDGSWYEVDSMPVGQGVPTLAMLMMVDREQRTKRVVTMVGIFLKQRKIPQCDANVGLQSGTEKE
jgi:hypothetical protein